MTRPTMDELRAKIGVGQWWHRRYAAEPGTGPAGKTCRDCAFLKNTGNSGMKSHYKCGQTDYTSGDATTIKVRSPACGFFRQWSPTFGTEESE